MSKYINNFDHFRSELQKNFANMTADVNRLFEVDVDKDELWSTYLESIPAEYNPLFRKRRVYDCSECRQFIKNFGNVVVIKNNEMHTIWEFDTEDEVFQIVADTLDRYIKAHAVTDVYVTQFAKIGVSKNHELREDGSVHVWEHLFMELPSRFVDRTHRSIGEIKATFRDTKNVFKRSLDEISQESIETVLELIGQNSLYRGEEWKGALQQFLQYKKDYEQVPEELRENYAWEKSLTAGNAIGRIRNHSIGVLLTDISDGADLDTAVRRYEAIVAPTNYKRPKAIFTKRMLEEAQKTVEELGYMDSLSRRFATLDDITVNNILFSNRDAAKRIAGGNVFEAMVADVQTNPKRFSRAEEIGIDKFIEDVLPSASELEVLLENKHIRNMVSLIGPQNPDAPSMFKWNNAFCWAYSGNITDSDIRENVKAAGGRVDGVLRFSIQWNDLDDDMNDLDAHCQEPNGSHIYFNNCRKPSISRMGGQLDVDIRFPKKGIPAVENITWPDKSRMRPGTYRFWVHNYSNRGGRKGFRAEIEFDGQIYNFDYPTEVVRDVLVAEVTLSKDGIFSIDAKLPSNVSSRDVWGVKTNQFMPVSVVMFSPNYWDEQKGIGHKHYFFMLKDCVNPEQPNGFFNEYLKEDLMKHKRVFEALGSKLAVTDADDQLSGVGFSSTKRADLIVKVKGATERVLKIKF